MVATYERAVLSSAAGPYEDFVAPDQRPKRAYDVLCRAMQQVPPLRLQDVHAASAALDNLVTVGLLALDPYAMTVTVTPRGRRALVASGRGRRAEGTE